MVKATFSNIENAKDYVMSETADAELQPAARKEFSELENLGDDYDVMEPDLIDVDDYRFVVNTTDDEVATVVTEGYNLTQHQHFFIPALEAVERVINPSEIIVRDDRARVDIEVLPDKPTTTNEEDFKLGLRLSNSFDKSVSHRILPYALRLVCKNGMIARKNFSSISKVHYGEKLDVEKLSERTGKLVENTKKSLNELVSRALSISVFEPGRILEAVRYPESYIEEIITKRRQTELGGYSNNAWSLYNDTTYIIEHEHDDVSEGYREQLHRKAEKVIDVAEETDGGRALLEETG